jgi:ABC-type arginine transport system permease subunit
MNCLGGRQVGVSFMQLFSLYGYSLSLFLPACLLCAIPNAAVQWTALLVATAFSAALILRNLITPIMEADAKSARALLGWFAGCQLILFLTLKVVFYK